jgi:NADH-quinone oxidoreductase subunit L
MVILGAPATWLAMAVVALGLVAWWQRQRLRLLSEPLAGLAELARNSFGFEALNGLVVRSVMSWAEDLRGLQTGMLNWNVVGIVAGLVMVLLIVALSAV